MIRDRDASYGQAVTKRLAAMGIRDHPIAPRSPWQNGHAERLIGSIRRECLDHIVVFGEAHLRQILAAYTGYYNECRTHLSLDKDSPGRRPIQRLGQLLARPILGGLYHQYCRISFLVGTGHAQGINDRLSLESKLGMPDGLLNASNISTLPEKQKATRRFIEFDPNDFG